MRARLPHLATALVLAAGVACWSDIKDDESQGTADSAAGAAPAGGQSGATLPGGTGPTAPVDTSGTAADPAATGPGRAAQQQGSGAGAKDTTAGARPPR